MTSACFENKKDPITFTISCTIGTFTFAKAVCDLGASVNLMSYAIFHKLGLGTPNPTKIKLLIDDRSTKSL